MARYPKGVQKKVVFFTSRHLFCVFLSKSRYLFGDVPQDSCQDACKLKSKHVHERGNSPETDIFNGDPPHATLLSNDT